MRFDAKWYSLLHTGNPDDVDFYKNAVRDATSVLELGCGAGRIGIPIAKNGVSVVGVDLEGSMTALYEVNLEACPPMVRERVQLVTADMRTLRLDRRFSKVIIPYNGLLCMTCERDVHRALTTAAAHLDPGGELLFDIYDVPNDFEDHDTHDDDDYSYIATINAEEAPVQVFEKALRRRDPRRFDAAYRYEIDKPRGKAELVCAYTIPQRCIFKEEIPTLLDRAGFELVSMTGDFQDLPVNENTEQLVIRARRNDGTG